jgi:hypothetical protein
MTELSTENTIQLEITPVPPATLSTTEKEVLPLIEAAIRDQGQGDLLDSGELKFEVQQTFPGTLVTIIVVKCLCKAAYKIVEKVVIPLLQKKYGVRQR